MYKTILILVISALAISCSRHNEASVEETATPFPKKYRGFYAGMSVDALKKNLELQHFAVDSRVYRFEENKGEPRIEASCGKLQLIAFIYDSKVCNLWIEGGKDADFLNDLLEISRSFEEGHFVGTTKVYRRDRLKTSVRPYGYYLSFSDVALADSLLNEKNNYEKKEMERIRKKYE